MWIVTISIPFLLVILLCSISPFLSGPGANNQPFTSIIVARKTLADGDNLLFSSVGMKFWVGQIVYSLYIHCILFGILISLARSSGMVMLQVWQWLLDIGCNFSATNLATYYKALMFGMVQHQLQSHYLTQLGKLDI